MDKFKLIGTLVVFPTVKKVASHTIKQIIRINNNSGNKIIFSLQAYLLLFIIRSMLISSLKGKHIISEKLI